MTDRPSLTTRTLLIALVTALPQFMQNFDGAVIAIALPPMAQDFGVSPVSVGLGITIYVLAASIVIPTSAWLSDRIGARTLLVWAVAGFGLASLLCGLSQTLWQFIAARAFQGVCGALMAPVAQIILLRSVERSQLLPVMNLSSIPMMMAPVLGPPLGGLLASSIGWQWIFYINLPICAVTVVMALRLLPDPKGDPKPFDTVGLLLNALALGPLLWGLGELGGAGASRAVPITAVVSGLIVGAFALRHAQRATHPLVSLSAMRHPTYRLTTGSGTILIRLPITAQIFVLPILLQAGFGMSALLSGLLFLWHTFADVLMKLFTTRAFRLFGYRRVIVTCTVVMAAAIAAAALFTRSTPLVVIAGVLFVSGAFRSFLMTGLSTLTFADVEPEEMASAATLMQVAVQLATAFGVSISSFVVETSPALLGAVPETATIVGTRAALVSTAIFALVAVPLFLRLPKSAGAELSGHAAGKGKTS